MIISIIIPVHNAEKYLARCLDSVIKSLGKIKGEIILIEDNSTDKTPEIIKSYRKKHLKLVRVLQSNKRGASAARNLGAKVAKGKYIWFIDADDYISEDAIAKLLAKAEKTSADLVMMRARRIAKDGSISDLSAIDPDAPDYRSRFVRYGMGPWQILIRRKWWQENRFKFCEGIIHEDMELMSSLILYTDNFASLDEPLYFYCENPESVLHKKDFNPHIFDIFPALKGLYQKFVDTKADKKYHDELEWFFIWNLLIDSAKDFNKFPEGKPGFGRSREMLKKYFPNWRRNRFLQQKPSKLKLRVRLNYYK